eukprot:3536499-Alexandrium_andersonii.AAC.1
MTCRRTTFGRSSASGAAVRLRVHGQALRDLLPSARRTTGAAATPGFGELVRPPEGPPLPGGVRA